MKKIFATDIKNRADKYYKKKTFDFLFRETISNAIHACIMTNKEDATVYIDVKIDIHTNSNDDLSYTIIIKDEGVGFNDEAYDSFLTLDKVNIEKISKNLPSLGQGRLALVYFADTSNYQSIFEDKDNKFYERIFSLDQGNELFEASEKEISHKKKSGTELTIKVKSPKANSFFNKYSNIDSFKIYIESTFYPLLNRNKNIIIRIDYNGSKSSINLNEIESKPFICLIGSDKENKIEEPFQLLYNTEL